jgi:putative membrane protein
MRLGRLLVIVMLMAQPSYAQSVGEKIGVNSMLGLTPKTPDLVKEAAESNLFVIQSAKLALLKADRKVKEFAEQLLADYTKSATELSVIADKFKLSLPTKVSTAQERLLQRQDLLDGDDFIQRFLDDEVAAQKSALSLFERYAKKGDNSDLKAWANERLPVLRRHLDLALSLDKSPNN